MRARARRTMVVCLASALAIALAAAPAAARPHPGVPEPPQWGDDILPIVHFVEKDRGFHFHHPVKVSLLSRRDFDEQVNSGGPLAGVDPQFRALLTRLGALGLIDSGIRPSDPAFANAGKVLGFYDPRSQEIVVRGADLSNPVTRVITAHELTHALDDQHFSAIEGESQPSFALTSLIEGDATAVELDYLQHLPAAARREADRFFASGAGTLHGPVEIVALLFDSAYTLGSGYVRVLNDLGRRNHAFADPPRTDDEILDPLRHGIGGPAPALGGQPVLGAGERRIGRSGQLGELLTFMTLAARLDNATALRAAVGWGNDRYLDFRRGTTDCVRFAVRGATAVDTTELAVAFARWAAAGVLGADESHVDGDDVIVTACESDRADPPNADHVADAVSLVLAGRLFWSERALRDGATHAVARCAGDLTALDPVATGVVQRARDRHIRFVDLTPSQQRIAIARLDAAVSLCKAQPAL